MSLNREISELNGKGHELAWKLFSSSHGLAQTHHYWLLLVLLNFVVPCLFWVFCSHFGPCFNFRVSLGCLTSQISSQFWLTQARTHFISGRKSFEITIFDFKMMVKSGLEFLFWNSPSPFRVAAAQCKKVCPEGLNWPDRLAGISEGARWISK